MRGYMIVLILSGLLASAGNASAQPSAGCMGRPGFDAFDFWLGQWDVYPYAGGPKAGVNVIRKIEGGCAIRESWTNRNGGTGQSLNFFNPVTDAWRQVWVTEQAYLIDISGGLLDGAMVLEGEIHYYAPRPDGGPQRRPFRGTWSLMEDGTVRQTFEQYDPDGDTWSVWFDGLYRRQIQPAAQEQDP